MSDGRPFSHCILDLAPPDIAWFRERWDIILVPLVNGHGSNVKVLDPLLRRIKYATGALVALYKPYAERYIGILEGLLENPPEETPG
jgi:hypothetical protein